MIRKQLGKNYKNLGGVLDNYSQELDDKDANLKIEGKLLEHANREQASWLAYYDERRIELYTYMKFFEAEIASVRSKCLKNMEQYPRELSDRAKDKYIDGHDDFLKIHEQFLAVKELYHEYESVVNCFIQRGYALRNITNLRCSSLEDVVI